MLPPLILFPHQWPNEPLNRTCCRHAGSGTMLNGPRWGEQVNLFALFRTQDTPGRTNPLSVISALVSSRLAHVSTRSIQQLQLVARVVAAKGNPKARVVSVLDYHILHRPETVLERARTASVVPWGGSGMTAAVPLESWCRAT